MLNKLVFLFSLIAGLTANLVLQLPQVTQFDNMPLDESLILYIDNEGNLTLEHIDSGTVARLTSSGDVVGFGLFSTRQTILYNDNSAGSYLISLKFIPDGRLIVSPPVGPFPAGYWSPDGTKLAYMDNRPYLVDVAARGEPLPLPSDILDFGGWSYDSRQLAYCTASGQLGIIDQTGTSQIVSQGLDCPPSLGSNMSWSPTASQLAYAVGDSREGFMDTYVYDVATGVTYPLPETGELMGWSPSGRLLAIGHGRVGVAPNFPSFTITDPYGQRAQTVPGIRTETAGVLGWLDRPTQMPLFVNRFVSEDLRFTDYIGSAVFDISADGLITLWGSNDGHSMSILCDDWRFSDIVIFEAMYPVLPEPNSPLSSAVRPFPGVEGRVSPDGQNALVGAHAGTVDGEGEWELHLLSCPDGRPLLKQVGTSLGVPSNGLYSASGRFLLLISPTSEGSVPQIYEISDDTIEVRRTYEGHPHDFEWLVTPYATPPVSQPSTQASPSTPSPPPPPASRQSSSGMAGVWVMLMFLGLFAWVVYMMQRK